jgi:hypothetical protein
MLELFNLAYRAAYADMPQSVVWRCGLTLVQGRMGGRQQQNH